MSPPAIAYDLVRLVLAARQRTPRGIDRIDYGLATRLMEDWPGDCVGVLPTPWGIRTFERARVLRARSYFEARWPGESRPAPEDPAAAPDLSKGRGRVPPRLGLRNAATIAGILSRTGLSAGEPVRSLPARTVLVNAGHDGLSQAWLLGWLRDRPDVRLLAMIHDLVPLTHPDLVSREATRTHARLLDHVASHAAAVLTPSHAVGRDVADALRTHGRTSIPITALSLPVQDIFLEHRAAPSPSPGPEPPAFVVCGTVEPRKNHSLLLDVWDLLAARHGAACPPLVIAGALGWQSEAVARRIGEVAPGGKVHWRPGLATPAIRSLMAGAAGVLMPSLAEGFGLPVAEGLTLGVPVLASDIPAHREAGGAFASYLPPADVQAWATAVESLALDRAAAAAARSRARAFVPTRWSDFMTGLGPVVAQVSAEPRIP